MIFEKCEIKVVTYLGATRIQIMGEMHIKNNPHQECI